MSARITPSTSLRASFCTSLALAILAASLPACHDVDDAPVPEADRKGDEITILPIFEYQGSAVSLEQAKLLEEKLGLAKKNALGADGLEGLVDEHGAIRFMDAERFLQIPTKTVTFKPIADEDKNQVAGEALAPDLAALAELKVLDAEAAIGLSKDLLAVADLAIDDAEPAVSNALFELRDADDKPILERAIDTTVHYDLSAAGVPLTGSGAKVKLVFDGAGELAQLTYARPLLAKIDSVAIVPQASAAELCAEHLGEALAGKVTFDARLVYNVAADAKKGAKILPSYACSGTQEVEGEVIELRTTLVPALLDQPKAAISLTPGAGTLIAEAEVDGGLAPYTFEWIREGGDGALPADEAAAARVEYTVTSRDPVASVRESLRLRVTDARGVRTEVSAEAEVLAPVWAAPVKPRVGGVRDAGVEWIGSCGGLGGSQNNAGGFVSEMSGDGVNVRFNFGNFSAWEQDFKDSAFGGDDDSYADNTDIVFFTGHAGGNGFSFCSESDDTLLRFDDARWGNDHDLEWLVIAACGPLQASTGGRSWSDRWGPAFDRLHLLLAYATTSYDNESEGRKLARYLTKSSPLDVRRAWVQTATDVQGSDVTYAVMGVLGQGFSMPNFTEYFWGHGSTGGDVPASQVTGYWRLSGAS